MEPFISFFSRHWMLSGLFLLLCLGLLINELILRRTSGRQGLSPEETVHWINHREAILIDTRNPQKFSEGHILGSLNITAEALDKKHGQLEKWKDKDIIVVCEAGQSSQKVVMELKKKGFKAFLLTGGLLAWRHAGLPLSKN